MRRDQKIALNFASASDPNLECMESDLIRGVEVIDSNDLEDFAIRLGEAIATWTNPGGLPPTVVFSHTTTSEGFNYVGIVSGNGPRAKEIEMRRTSEDITDE